MMPVPGVPKPRKPRPSRARGLRTTTGCLTCRKRRVKCDENKPRCGPCTKSDRECVYADSTPITDAPSASNVPTASHLPNASNPPNASEPPNFSNRPGAGVGAATNPRLFGKSPDLAHFDLSPLAITASLPSPHGAPLDWYDLLAQDAINNIQKHNLGFDRTVLSRRQSPVADGPDPEPKPKAHEPWNTLDAIPLHDEECNLLQYYVNVVAPILDVFDPANHFATCVPRLAVHNVGLLKSLLAVAARHMVLHSEEHNQVKTSDQAATQYYYNTLRYLSQNFFYPAYSQSDEIIATAILISTYEMFDADRSYGNGAWERHLRGIFWIQKFQGNNGESNDGLRRAAWWSWIRQDTWVAFREGRRVLTIFRPTKRLVDLTPDELATRILYLTARCVDYASTQKQTEMNVRIEQGDKLLQALEDWYRVLPSSFQPIYKATPSESSVFSPTWIQPPMYAAALQTFHFARIVVLINQPSMGGMAAFRQRQRYLDESVEMIGSIAMMQQGGRDLSSASVNFQAIYAAGLCVQTSAKQTAILQLLEKALDVGKFPPKTLLDDLASYWREDMAA